MKKILIIIVVLVLIILGLRIYKLNFTNNDIRNNNSTQINSHDGTYVIAGQKVTLKNGISEIEASPGSASKIVTKYFGNDLIYDLNDDGIADDIFLVTQDAGGSGVFYYVVALVSTPSGLVGSDGVLLGDRIAPQTINIDEGKTTKETNRQIVIAVNYADRKPNEPMTATPTMGVSKYFKISNGKLVEVIKSPTSCTPNWQCGWGSCNNGYQGMTAVDSNSCGLPSTKVNIACPALARQCVSSTQTSEKVTKKVGEKEFNFLIQKINANSIDGLMYTLYPVAMLQGQPKTLNIGDIVGYACEGKTATLSNIDATNQKAIFNETIKNAPPGGCPI